MSSHAQEFAVVALAAFRDAGHYTDDEVSEAGGPSTATMTKLRKVAEGEGEMPAPRGDTLRRIDKAARWADGSARELWLHGTPPTMARPTLEEVVSGQLLDGAQLRERHRRSRPTGIEGYIETLAARVLDLEERLDDIEARLEGGDGQGDHGNPASNTGGVMVREDIVTSTAPRARRVQPRRDQSG